MPWKHHGKESDVATKEFWKKFRDISILESKNYLKFQSSYMSFCFKMGK
jgi:hypothetical protein